LRVGAEPHPRAERLRTARPVSRIALALYLTQRTPTAKAERVPTSDDRVCIWAITPTGWPNDSQISTRRIEVSTSEGREQK